VLPAAKPRVVSLHTTVAMAVVHWDPTARALSWIGIESDELPALDPQVCACSNVAMCTLLLPACL
jgi:hypothetical protein